MAWVAVDNIQGQMGAPGPSAPTVIPAGGLFAVLLDTQALAFLPIHNDGDIIVSGELVFI